MCLALIVCLTKLLSGEDVILCCVLIVCAVVDDTLDGGGRGCVKSYVWQLSRLETNLEMSTKSSKLSNITKKINES